MNEHDDQADERVDDLDVPDSESEEVKGGLLPSAGQEKQTSWKQAAGQFNVKLNPGGASFGDGSV